MPRWGLRGWRRGAVVGGTIAAGVLVVYAVAAAIPATRDVFSDERVGEGWPFLVYHSLIRIPLGTVVLEELAFRAALPALFTPPTSTCHADRGRSGRFRMTERVPAGGGARGRGRLVAVRVVARAAGVERQRRQPARCRRLR
ncbi:MAG: hypothetical protein WKF58_04945 [Ilumatobacteraceae bacterium]